MTRAGVAMAARATTAARRVTDAMATSWLRAWAAMVTAPMATDMAKSSIRLHLLRIDASRTGGPSRGSSAASICFSSGCGSRWTSNIMEGTGAMFSSALCFAFRVTAEEEEEVHAILHAALGEGIHENEKANPGFSDDERGGERQAGAHVNQSGVPGSKPKSIVSGGVIWAGEEQPRASHSCSRSVEKRRRRGSRRLRAGAALAGYDDVRSLGTLRGGGGGGEHYRSCILRTLHARLGCDGLRKAQAYPARGGLGGCDEASAGGKELE